MVYDKIIIGAGLYGLYAAEWCGRRGERVLVIESVSNILENKDAFFYIGWIIYLVMLAFFVYRNPQDKKKKLET